MKKAEVIAVIAKDAGISQADAKLAYESLFATITKTMKKGDSIAIPSFGTFKVSKRAARMGRNPQTGAPLKIKARNAASFKASSVLKDALN
ncbi:MAG: hypothetical protein DRP42_01690 [Tenericutes bacterium]|nr:MAG: hypothetical protein DRP42_01690 [Mycoplasmatota bacterium]